MTGISSVQQEPVEMIEMATSEMDGAVRNQPDHDEILGSVLDC